MSFNGKHKYSEETRQAVLNAAKRLGYRPNLAAKSLITNHSNLIGLILPSYVDHNTLTTSPFYNIVMDGIYSVLQYEQYYDLIIYSVPDRARLSQVNDWIESRGVDGVLAIGELSPVSSRKLIPGRSRSFSSIVIRRPIRIFPTSTRMTRPAATWAHAI